MRDRSYVLGDATPLLPCALKQKREHSLPRYNAAAAITRPPPPAIKHDQQGKVDCAWLLAARGTAIETPQPTEYASGP